MEGRGRRPTLEGSWEWLEFASQLPAKAVPFSGISARTVLFSGRCVLRGLSFSNAATTAGVVDALDGLDGTGMIAWRTPAAASSTGQSPVPQPGILLEIGLTLNLTTVQITGAALVVPLWHYARTPPGQ